MMGETAGGDERRAAESPFDIGATMKTRVAMLFGMLVN
jgi:hypothetical protein